MRNLARKAKESRGAAPAERAGQACDARCWEASVRSRGFERRLSIPGSTRVS